MELFTKINSKFQQNQTRTIMPPSTIVFHIVNQLTKKKP
jgi:hypothetical protein